MSKVDAAFEAQGRVIPLAAILPLRKLTAAVKASRRYRMIAGSVAEVGIIEPPVVFADRRQPGSYHLLDGHLRVEILKDRGEHEVFCLLATDDEAFTYNKRINRLAPIQEHFMIVRAIARGVPEARIARALGVNVARIRQKRALLHGICPEVAELLKDKHVSGSAVAQLKKMRFGRQIEAAELMLVANTFTQAYARALLAATPQDQLVDTAKPKQISGVSAEQMARMEREMANLQCDLKQIEDSYGGDVLNLVLARGYLVKLLGNPSVSQYLDRHQPDIGRELRGLVDSIASEHTGAASMAAVDTVTPS
jgi:ParB-like chromosome segregation protein Spo0J